MAEANLKFDIFARDRASRVFDRVSDAADRVSNSNRRVRDTGREMGADMTENASGIGRALSSAASLAASNWVTAAAAITAIVGALPIAAQAAGGAMVLGLGAGLAGIGLMAAAQNKKVRNSFSGLLKHVKTVAREIAAPFVPSLLAISQFARRTFDSFKPELRRSFESMAPVVTDFADQFFRALEQFKPAIKPITDSFNALLKSIGPQLPTIFGNIANAVILVSNAVAQNPDAFTGLIVAVSKLVVVAAQLVVKLIQVWHWLKQHPAVVNAVGTAITLLANPIGAAILIFNLLKGAVQRAGSILGGLGRTAVRIGAMVLSGLGRLASLPGRFAAWFGGAARAAGARLSALVAAARRIPGRIRSAVGSLAGLLVAAGRNVVNGLINGITSRIGALAATASRLAGTVRNFLPFSPAREGPLSGSGAPEMSGRRLAANFAAGIESQRALVAAASAGLAGSAAGSMRGGAGGSAAAAGRDVRLIIDVTGADEDWKRIIRRMVRVDGRGNVQVAFG